MPGIPVLWFEQFRFETFSSENTDRATRQNIRYINKIMWMLLVAIVWSKDKAWFGYAHDDNSQWNVEIQCETLETHLPSDRSKQPDPFAGSVFEPAFVYLCNRKKKKTADAFEHQHFKLTVKIISLRNWRRDTHLWMCVCVSVEIAFRLRYRFHLWSSATSFLM